MGPLVPDIIGNELNFVVAIIIGIAFGFILEQAGFSTSKKLVGLFYGYDFTVLRVFFTAGIVAMLGVIALNHFGLLDINLIYVNPTFLWSAIIGGLIMGIGFVIGGFCPGTSVCAAAIGKIDAMIFIAGSFLGVYAFAEGYPMLEEMYKAEAWGNVTVFEILGISQSLTAFIMVLFAVSAFWITTIIEQKVNGKPNPEFQPRKLYYALTIIAVIMGISSFAMPDRRTNMMNRLNDAEYVSNYKVESMDIDELTFRLIDDDKNIQILDLRVKAAFDSLSLPKSTNMTLKELFDKDANKLLSKKKVRNIFIAYDENTAKQAAVLASELGYPGVYYLEGGMKKFNAEILNFKQPEQPVEKKFADTYRYRAMASEVLPEKIKEYKLKQGGGEKKKSKRVVGGC